MIKFSEPQNVVNRLAFIDRIVVPAWLLLTVAMVLAYLSLDAGSVGRWAVVAMLVTTWTHPLYSRFAGALRANLFAVAVFSVVVVVVMVHSVGAGLLVFPTLPWVASAAAYTAARTQLGLTR